jgi:hypothetical protein
LTAFQQLEAKVAEGDWGDESDLERPREIFSTGTGEQEDCHQDKCDPRIHPVAATATPDEVCHDNMTEKRSAFVRNVGSKAEDREEEPPEQYWKC